MGLSSMCNSVKSLNWSAFHVDFGHRLDFMGRAVFAGKAIAPR